MEAVGFSAEPTATPQVRGGMMVSGNYFHVLGVDPQLGRGFREDEDQLPGRDAVVVLGPDFWKHEFASDPSLLGRTVRLKWHGVHRDWRGSGDLPGEVHPSRFEQFCGYLIDLPLTVHRAARSASEKSP
jgi:hypothetical protein